MSLLTVVKNVCIMENMKIMQNIKIIYIISFLIFLWCLNGNVAAALLGWFLFTAFAMPDSWRS